MRTERVFWIVIVLLLVAKFALHWAISPALIMIMSALGCIYFPLGFYFFSGKTLKEQNVPVSVISGIILSIVPAAVLFKVMYWPGAQQMLTSAVFSTSILLVVLFYLKSKSGEYLLNYYRNMLKRTIVLWAVSAVFILTPIHTLLYLQHPNDPEMVRLKEKAFNNGTENDYEILHHYIQQKDSLEQVN